MDVLPSFLDEVLKLASDGEAETKRPKHTGQNYLASMLIGGAAAPALKLVSALLQKKLRNRALGHELERAGSAAERKLIQSHIHTGPIIGHASALPVGKAPLVTTDDLAGRAVTGALTGSAVQALRDRFAPSTPQPKKPI